MTSLRHHIPLTLVTLAMIISTGCSGGGGISEGDNLRRQVLDLQKENERLTLREKELTAELRTQSQRPDSLPVEIRENTPRVAAIALDQRSHARDDNDDGRPDHLLLYISPEDGLGRFTQLVGHLSAHAAMLPTDADATTIGRWRLTPGEVRAAYRSGITGTHYTIKLPIEAPQAFEDKVCLVRVEFEDGHTGERLSVEREILLSR